MFINEECGYLIVVNGGGGFTENISEKRQPIIVGESISSVTYWIFIVKQLGKHNFSCDFFTT